jgi:hypothetical protein
VDPALVTLGYWDSPYFELQLPYLYSTHLWEFSDIYMLHIILGMSGNKSARRLRRRARYGRRQSCVIGGCRDGGGTGTHGKTLGTWIWIAGPGFLGRMSLKTIYFEL